MVELEKIIDLYSADDQANWSVIRTCHDLN